MKISSISYNYNFIPNHLGSGTLITDINGNPYQFFLNLPFGETFVDRHSQTGNYENVYKFNGKELDTETGLYYYGARYYNPRISQFYATDPLAEKYPGFSPYTYTADNPVMLVDPNGMDWYKNNETGEITWYEGNEEKKGYTYLGYFVSETDVDGNEIFYDGVTKTQYIDGVPEMTWGGDLDEVVITAKVKKKNCNKNIITLTDKSNEVLKKLDYYSSDNTMMGVNLSALELKSIENSEYVYKYASGNLSAIELTAINKATQLKIVKFAKYGGRAFAALGAVTSIYQYSQDEISEYRLAGDLFFTVLPVILPGVGTLVSIVYFTGTVVYDTTIKDNE